MPQVVFRCDGDERIGAGHVARCLQLALAFRLSGDEVLFAGCYEGLAAELLGAAGVPRTPPADAPAGIPSSAALAVVDSYELAASELEAAATAGSVARLLDVAERTPGPVTLSYHPGAEADLAGPAYTPVDPRYAALRRKRGFARVLVSFGGGAAGAKAAEDAAAAAEEAGLEVERPSGVGGLLAACAGADVALTAGGLTPYELACAGVPTAVAMIAANQEPVVRGLEERGAALAASDGPGAALARLSAEAGRERLAEAGPALVDGYGAFRARDGLRALLAGQPLPRVLMFRPATDADSERQLAWRNDSGTRAASRSTAEIPQAEHEDWLNGVLADPKRTLLVVEDEGGPAGSVRFDHTQDEAEISVMVAPERRGAGLGRRLVRQASELYLASRPEVRRVVAEIHGENAMSRAVFAAAGFSPLAGGAPDGSLMLALERSHLASAPV